MSDKRLSLKLKRKIARSFLSGESIWGCAYNSIGIGSIGIDPDRNEETRQTIENVLRDFMNGKFSLAPRKTK